MEILFGLVIVAVKLILEDLTIYFVKLLRTPPFLRYDILERLSNILWTPRVSHNR